MDGLVKTGDKTSPEFSQPILNSLLLNMFEITLAAFQASFCRMMIYAHSQFLTLILNIFAFNSINVDRAVQ